MILILCVQDSPRTAFLMLNTLNAHPLNLAECLAHSGLRNTPQREVVYRALLDKRNHPTADEVYSRVRSEMPTISLATVYNCLETLVQCNLVRQVDFERGSSRYCPNLAPHAHFHDEQTGIIIDIDLPLDLLARIRALLPSGYSAKAVEITFHGQSPSA